LGRAEPRLRPVAVQAASAPLIVFAAARQIADFVLREFFFIFQHRHRIVIAGVVAEVCLLFGEPLRQFLA